MNKTEQCTMPFKLFKLVINVLPFKVVAAGGMQPAGSLELCPFICNKTPRWMQTLVAHHGRSASFRALRPSASTRAVGDAYACVPRLGT